MSKEFVDPAKTQASLLNLREEILRGPFNYIKQEMIFKINSCLYSEYPHRNDNETD